MKKSFLMIAAAATLFVACTERDTFSEIKNETDLIGFETFHSKATKASVSSASDLTDENGGFGVYGFKHLNNRTANDGAINLSDVSETNNANYVTPIFDNVKVWYSNGASTKNFTYAVPKYWDKLKYYTFFAYAPQVAKATSSSTGITFDQATGKFTRNDILALQKVNSTTTETVGQNDRTLYGAADESTAIDYLIAPYVPSQKSGTTNQTTAGGYQGTTYTGQEQTVGFTFSHILSKLNVIVKAKDEASGHKYAGVTDIEVTKLNITNLPNNNEVAKYAQNRCDGAAGTWTPNNYSSTTLNIIAGENPTSSASLFVLDGGSISGTTITNPTKYLDQQFHYFVAPNAPTSGNKYTLNIDYTIHYVDNTTEPFSRSIDLSTETANFTKMEQNNIYNITVTIALNQIYFSVDAISGWDTTENNTGVTVD